MIRQVLYHLGKNDQPTGGLTVRLVPSNSSKQSQGGGGGTPNFAYKRILQSLVLMLVINHEGINNL
ncbi:MAG: hypothetical protein CM15mV69_630 [Caudoviricetes sp.]|nr:MAG: hypothetical protein CM15mV69_630 [Caudoviricetes sp.]